VRKENEGGERRGGKEVSECRREAEDGGRGQERREALSSVSLLRLLQGQQRPGKTERRQNDVRRGERRNAKQ